MTIEAVHCFDHKGVWVQMLVWLSGFVQTLLYADFFYYYAIALKEGSKFQLPG